MPISEESSKTGCRGILSYIMVIKINNYSNVFIKHQYSFTMKYVKKKNIHWFSLDHFQFCSVPGMFYSFVSLRIISINLIFFAYSSHFLIILCELFSIELNFNVLQISQITKVLTIL